MELGSFYHLGSNYEFFLRLYFSTDAYCVLITSFSFCCFITIVIAIVILIFWGGWLFSLVWLCYVITTHGKINDCGYIEIKIRNASIIDRELPKCSILATGTYVKNYTPLSRGKTKKNGAGKSLSTLGDKSTPTDKSVVGSDKDTSNNKTPTSGEINEVQSSNTTNEEIPTKTEISTVPCFCAMDEKVIILRGNKFGDTVIPYASYVGYNRSELSDGKAFKFKRGTKTIVILYGPSEKEIKNVLEICPKGTDVAYITNHDKTLMPNNVKRVHISGECDQHPFPYHLEPQYVSFALTDNKTNSHHKMIHNLKERIVIKLANMVAELYWDPNDHKQAHFVLHIPDIMIMQNAMLHNYVASLLMPFASSVRILEPYTGANNYKQQCVLTLLGKLAKLHNVTIQARSPAWESKTYKTNPHAIKHCPCDYCIGRRDREIYVTKKHGQP